MSTARPSSKATNPSRPRRRGRKHRLQSVLGTRRSASMCAQKQRQLQLKQHPSPRALRRTCHRSAPGIPRLANTCALSKVDCSRSMVTPIITKHYGDEHECLTWDDAKWQLRRNSVYNTILACRRQQEIIGRINKYLNYEVQAYDLCFQVSLSTLAISIKAFPISALTSPSSVSSTFSNPLTQISHRSWLNPVHV